MDSYEGSRSLDDLKNYLTLKISEHSLLSSATTENSETAEEIPSDELDLQVYMHTCLRLCSHCNRYSCASTKTVPDSVSVHTKEWWFRRDFSYGTKLRRAPLISKVERHVLDKLCATLWCCVKRYSDIAEVGARTGIHWDGSKYSGWRFGSRTPNPHGQLLRLNPLNPESDQHPISPCNINAL